MKKKKLFMIGHLIKSAWKDFKENIWFFISIMAALFLIQIFLKMVRGSSEGSLVFPASIIVLILSAIVGAAIIRIFLRFVDSGSTKFENIIPPAQHVLYYIAFWVIIMLIVTGIVLTISLLLGLSLDTSFTMIESLDGAKNMSDVFAIIGSSLGIMTIALLTMLTAIAYVSTRFMFTTYSIVDKNYTTFQAMRMSARMTKGMRWKLFGLLIVLAFLNMLGALIFGIGLLITMPMTFVILTRVYRELEAHTQSNKSIQKKNMNKKASDEKVEAKNQENNNGETKERKQDHKQ